MENRESELWEEEHKGGDNMNSAASTLLTVAAVAGVAAGVYVGYQVYHGAKESADKTPLLEKVMGEPMYTGTFTLKEATAWIKAHLQSGCQGIIFRANGDTLKNFKIRLNLTDDLEKYLVMAVTDTSNQICDSVLIKFDELDQGLQNALGEEGSLVIKA